MRSVLEFCAVEDHQAQRYLDIVGRFHRSIVLNLSQARRPLPMPAVTRTIRTAKHNRDCDFMSIPSDNNRPKPMATGVKHPAAESPQSPEGNMSAHSGGTVSTATLDINGVPVDAIGPPIEVSFYYNDLYQPKFQELGVDDNNSGNMFGVASYGQAPWSSERLGDGPLPQ